MTRALVHKELLQHGWALAVVMFLSFCAYGLIVAVEMAHGQSGSAFESARLFVMVMSFPASLILGHRLVVLEYQSKTQLFLEALPLSRSRMALVKYLLGLSVVFALSSAALATAWILAARGEAIEPRQFSIIAARTFAYVWFVYNFFFLMGFFGRYRITLYLAILIGLMGVELLTAWEFQRFAPLVLMDERYAYEGEVFPADALRTTLALGGIFVALALVLALTREGSVAALLAEKMSHREKVFVATLLVGFVFLVAVLDEKQKKEAFELQGAWTEERTGVAVRVAQGHGIGQEQARELSARVADELAGVREYLGLRELPPVFITFRRDLDADRYERGDLLEAEGVLARVNYGGTGWDEQRFAAWLIREVLITSSHGRSKLEENMWVLDGFSLFWQTRERAGTWIDEQPFALRALYGTSAGFTEQDLRSWHLFRERVGADIASAVAWSGLSTLSGSQGPELTRIIIRAALAMNTPRDLRAMLHRRRNSVERLFEHETGLNFGEFLGEWQRELARGHDQLAAELQTIPVLVGEVEYEPLSSESRKVVYRLSPGAGWDGYYSFLYCNLPPFDQELNMQLVRREKNSYLTASEGELPGSYLRGARFSWTFAAEIPALGCRVISGWKREEIR
jgi:hypothetical protein